MKCDELLRRLTEYEDGALDKELCQALEAHLLECVPCEELRRDLLQLKTICQKSPRPEMPAGLRDRLRALLRDED
jgi:hypothetical protein